MLIDTHCHLNMKEFKNDADEVIKDTLNEGIEMIVVGAQYSTSERAIRYAEKYNKGVWAVVGLHPIHIDTSNVVKTNKSVIYNDGYAEVFDYDKYLKLAKNDKVVAIGEVGLDYHHFDTANMQINYESILSPTGMININNNNKIKNDKLIHDEGTIGHNNFEKYKKEIGGVIELQKEVFKNFVKLAGEVQKPLAIHCWNADKKDRELVNGAMAYEDILEILVGQKLSVNSLRSSDKINRGDNLTDNKVNYGGRALNGVIHSFIGSYKIAQRFIDLGFKIGLNGIITYSDSYNRLIKEIGLENIILETDAPYLTPNPLKRYTRNEPKNVKLVAQKIADVLGIGIEEVEEITTENACQLFNIL